MPSGCEAVGRLIGSSPRTTGWVQLVVSLGVDAARDDPESPLQVTVDGYAEAGRMIGELGFPTVFVQEGGYHLDSLGGFVLATLLAFEGEKRERHD